MSEKPPADLLSDLLGNMRLVGTVLFRARFREPWAVVTPESCQLVSVLPYAPRHVIPFHVVASGGCSIRLPGAEPVWLAGGDAVLLPYGDSHTIAGRDAATEVPVGGLLPHPPWHEIPLVEHGGAGAATQIICGFLQCDELMFHPVGRALPPLLHVSPDGSAADPWLAATIRHTAAEASQASPGSRSMLPRLTELMFVEVLRKHMGQPTAGQVGWFAACNDPVAGPALKALHAAPLEAWTLDRLAQRVGASRTVLSERFRRLLDQPPMQYLARWRLQLAAHRLRTTDLPLKAIAEAAGYESEAGFSRAFKRHLALPPADWRRRQSRP